MKKRNFTQIQNHIFADIHLSLKAKGLYGIIHSLISDSRRTYTKEDFYNKTREGKKAFNAAWDELKKAGYLKVNIYSNGNNFRIEYILLDDAEKGAHTFYFNNNQECTRTNLGIVDNKENICIYGLKTIVDRSIHESKNIEDVRTPRLGYNANGGNKYNNIKSNNSNNDSIYIDNKDGANTDIKSSIDDKLVNELIKKSGCSLMSFDDNSLQNERLYKMAIDSLAYLICEGECTASKLSIIEKNSKDKSHPFKLFVNFVVERYKKAAQNNIIYYPSRYMREVVLDSLEHFHENDTGYIKKIQSKRFDDFNQREYDFEQLFNEVYC